MVCVQQAKQESNKTQTKARQNSIKMDDEELAKEAEGVPVVSHENSWLNAMDATDGEYLQLKHMAGGSLVNYPPLFAQDDDIIIFRDDQRVLVYSTITCELVRSLEGATARIVNMEFELDNAEILVACTFNGDLLRWHWRTGELREIKKLLLPDKQVRIVSFNLINCYLDSDRAAAFVITYSAQRSTEWHVFNTSTGQLYNVPCDLPLTKFATPPLVAVETKYFYYMTIVFEGCVIFLDYKTWGYKFKHNSYGRKITAVAVHPTEQCAATGDVIGQILLWRDFFNKKQKMVTTLYHWHHTAITSIAFSEIGSSFYSSGLEAVLVRWNIAKANERSFMPRLNSYTRHIAVQPGNATIVVCNADNSVQFMNGDMRIQQTLQEFGFAIDDKTDRSKFPVGLKVNPRSNTLVLNGRSGHLQFYSTYSRSMLYNLNIVNNNVLSFERNQILYNTAVTKAAFNIDWLVTGEVYNDMQHLPELCLKFWHYDESKQSYKLNTNIEMPHEGGFRAIEFSNCNQVDDLLCATVGDDNLIRIWALQSADNIYRPDAMTWGCIAQTNYKNMPIESIGFSQDGSLLAAGFGNTLCIYAPETLKLRTALNCAAGFDGCAQKARITLPTATTTKSPKSKSKSSPKPAKFKSTAEQRQKVLQLFQQILESNNSDNSSKYIKDFNEICSHTDSTKSEPTPTSTIGSTATQSALFTKILRRPELNLIQKLQIFQKLNIRCKVRQQQKSRMFAFLKKHFGANLQTEKIDTLEARLHQLSLGQRFKAKYRLEDYKRQQKLHDFRVSHEVEPVYNILGFNDRTVPVTPAQKAKPGGKKRARESAAAVEPEMEAEEEEDNQVESSDEDFASSSKYLPSVPQPAQITHIQFAAGEYAYLVVVCTKTRILVWNLLTLRVQAVLKINVQDLAFDPATNLVAAYTQRRELHIFQPNVPLPIYQRSGMPILHGLCWVPRRHPKPTSINIDWQSHSTLYMLTDDQAIKYLGAANAKDDDSPTSTISFNQAAVPAIQYTTFGTYATKQNIARQNTRQPIGQLIIGNSRKEAVKAITDMSAHTMPPLSLLCNDFVKALVKTDQQTPSKPEQPALTNGDASKLMNGHGNESDSELEDNVSQNRSSDNKLQLRKSILAKSDELSNNAELNAQEQEEAKEKMLQDIAKMKIEIEL